MKRSEEELNTSNVLNNLTVVDITNIVNAFTDINIPVEAVIEEINLNRKTTIKTVDEIIDHSFAEYFNDDGISYFKEIDVKLFINRYANQFKEQPKKLIEDFDDRQTKFK